MLLWKSYFPPRQLWIQWMQFIFYSQKHHYEGCLCSCQFENSFLNKNWQNSWFTSKLMESLLSIIDSACKIKTVLRIKVPYFSWLDVHFLHQFCFNLSSKKSNFNEKKLEFKAWIKTLHIHPWLGKKKHTRGGSVLFMYLFFSFD